MHPVKRTLKKFLNLSLTVHEIFLANVLLVVSFGMITESVLDLGLGGSIGVLCIVSMAFFAPLYSTGKMIFGTSTLNKSVGYTLEIWATVWLMVIIPMNFILLFSRLSIIYIPGISLLRFLQNLSLTEYMLIIYLGLNTLRLTLLFFFSAYLRINRFGVTQFKLNKVFYIGVIMYSLYVIFNLTQLQVELPVDVLFNQLYLASVSFISGSLIMELYYFIFGRELSNENK